jgi:hypothetical protein
VGFQVFRYTSFKFAHGVRASDSYDSVTAVKLPFYCVYHLAIDLSKDFEYSFFKDSGLALNIQRSF